MKLISIITINLNNKDGLLQTLKSVLLQQQKNFEFVVVDGESNDGSIELIENYKSCFDKIVVEKDNGIYHAMNKAIKLVTGKFVLFLNSGDTLVDNQVLFNLTSTLSNTKADIVYCRPNLINDKGERLEDGTPVVLSFDYFLLSTLNHQSTFIRRELFTKLGSYDLKYRYVADFEFWIRAFLNDKNCFEYNPTIISNYQLIGVSSKIENKTAIDNERNEILKPFFLPQTIEAMNTYRGILSSSFMGIFDLYKKEKAFKMCIDFIYASRLMIYRLKSKFKSNG